MGVLVITILANGMVLNGVNPYIQNVVLGVVVVAAVAITIDRRKTDVVK
jgi:ribose/xylose/arabinose/galactoside ABC-type transport system permease subunit